MSFDSNPDNVRKKRPHKPDAYGDISKWALLLVFFNLCSFTTLINDRSL
jgi:hypothetical protein